MVRARDTDACPGALQVHQAADGALVRVRLPGGMITAAQLAALAGAATGFGSGTLELTARGNMQLRAITDVTAVAEAIAGAGLLPSATHERVRNIVASPLSGRVGGRADVRAWVRRAGRGDLRRTRTGANWAAGSGSASTTAAAMCPAWAPTSGVHVFEDGCALLLAGRDTGIRLAVGDVVTTLVDIAVRFVEIRGTAWRVKELADISRVVARRRARRTAFRPSPARRWAGSIRTTAGSRWAPRCRWVCCPHASPSSSPRSRPRW